MIYDKEKRIELKRTISFKESSKYWNKLNLNHGFTVGYLMNLLDKSHAKTFEEWELYYFKSGNERINKINSRVFDKEIKMNLLTFNRNIPKKYYKYNTGYGRTKNDLIVIAKKLDEAIKVGLELAINYVYIRIIDETWIGHEREVKTLLNLKKYLSIYGFTVEKTSAEIDINYGVDFEIKMNNKLIAGLQLKSTNYLNNKNNLQEIIGITEEKNNLYRKKFNKPVYFLYINSNGLIMNLNDIYYLIIRKQNELQTHFI